MWKSKTSNRPDNPLRLLIYKIQMNPHNKNIIYDNDFYLLESTPLDYAETKNYLILCNDEIKLIKYFYKLIKKNWNIIFIIVLMLFD